VSQGTVNILLVEDNEVDVEGVQRAFQRYKIRNPIIVATDGIEALEMLRGTGDAAAIQRPYMIILDLNLPRMDGIEFLRELRRDPELRDSIVFVLTTSQDADDKVASYSFNVAGYMVKSRIGEGFLGLCEMLDCYWRIVEFPPGNPQRG
jgi:CheY-like chemotaxis protein